MKKLKEILFKRHYIREIMTLFFIVLSLLFLSVYSSLAIFRNSYVIKAVATIQASTLNITMSTPEEPAETTTKSITVPAGETVFSDVTVTNNSSVAVRYKLYYSSTNTNSSVVIGISSASENAQSGVLTSSETEGYQKTVRVGVTNGSASNVTVTLGVQSGYAHNEVALSSGSALTATIEEKPHYPIFVDTSGANEPVLADGMIPVVYDDDDDVWLVADTEKGYYAYQDQIWANAVTVTSTNRNTYLSAKPGTPIPMDDINSMWVWIPRYRYNIPSNMGSSSNVTNPPQIDVIFEPGTETNGVTETVYRNGISDDGTNTNYYTHPAFRNIDNIEYDSSTSSRGAWDEEITGFWVGKFETGTTNETCNTSASKANCLDVDPIIKPDVLSLRYQTVSTQFITALKFAGGTFNSDTGAVTFTANTNNIYGLNTKTNTTDTHMMKNTEWGSVAILSQSQYGKMGNANYTDVNKEVYKNNSYSSGTSIYTGKSSGVPPAMGNLLYGTYSYNDKTCGTDSAECTGEKVAYAGTGASITGTIYGIYDMSGGSNEYTMGNWASTTKSSGFTTFPSSKYYDLYNGTSSSSVTKEKAILGDATWETMKWYSDNARLMKADSPWVYRGGYSVHDSVAGVFYSYYSAGDAIFSFSFRPLLIP